MAEIEKIICTSCGKEKKATNPGNKFYQSQSVLYKHYQHIPVCKDCIDIIFNNYKNKYKDEKITMYNFCRLLDLPYSESSFDGAVQNSEKTGWKIYQSYFKQINSFGDINNVGICFENGEYIENSSTQTDKNRNNINDISLEALSKEDEYKIDLETQIFWGYGFEPKDYMFLEVEITNWKKTHKCDNQAELTLLREICIKILEIRRLREKKQSVSKEQKELQDLMKTASVDPAKSNAINSGDNVDRFGVWIKDIEQSKPAEWWEDQEKYKDMDGFMPYIKNYIVRPIKNFFTGSKDFLINGEDLSFSNKDGEEDE